MAIGSVICLVIDRLHAGYLGAYGNTWIRTPAFDRLAAESFVFDRAIVDSPDLTAGYHSLWLGTHVLCQKPGDVTSAALPTRLAAAGKQTILLTDEHEIATHPLAEMFAEQIVVSDGDRQSPRARQEIVESVDESDAAAFFAAAGDFLGSARSPYFLWLHTGTLGRVWDAPLEFREQYTDEDDPPPSHSSEVPNRLLPEGYDPDELVAISHAYAAQVTLLDELVGSLLEALESTKGAKDTLLMLFSPRGFPLGEHRRVGPMDDALYAELVHVPWMIRFPNGRAGAVGSARSQRWCSRPICRRPFSMRAACRLKTQRHSPAAR